MATLINRGLSLLVATAYITAAYYFGDGAEALKTAICLLLPMACIWFSEELGSFTGIMHYHAITSPSPAFLVCALGWLLMVGLPIVFYLITGSTPEP